VLRHFGKFWELTEARLKGLDPGFAKFYLDRECRVARGARDPGINTSAPDLLRNKHLKIKQKCLSFCTHVTEIVDHVSLVSGVTKLATPPRLPTGVNMRISQIHIQNFRSHSATSVAFDDYTALVGANGAGKSSVFYALRWFFEGHAMAPGDVFSDAVPEASGEADADALKVTVKVDVTFVDLTAADRERLGEYG
jgi:hypothetical protein